MSSTAALLIQECWLNHLTSHEKYAITDRGIQFLALLNYLTKLTGCLWQQRTIINLGGDNLQWTLTTTAKGGDST